MAGDFVDLIAWQQAVALAQDAFAAARVMRGPGSVGAADHLRRAAESIPANIAEGYGRGIGRDFARFLSIASASAAEVESHLRLAVAVARLPESRAEPVVARARRVRALVRGLARRVAAPKPSRRPPSH